ncbi:DUF1097 domain-containing protein [Luteibacter aegosomatissinici]|uniref:DUF1097 domain-containing protein n=1 Tax=Luteibacter aegosomatissinici TaxID=2911539 RepID=UPI001FF8360F|nr:DUF1097 domain-containing protein [Luteibacter aegosomatissinici]UPG95910.1 DUF1097 domain-containing protein [Luteibacter aegosomatissinici]
MSHARQSPTSFIVTTLVAAVTAAVAAASSAALSLPVWAMFIGWIAFFTRGMNTRGAFENLACVGLGLTIGAIAAFSLPHVGSILGPRLALPVVVFVVALLVVAMRGMPILNNLLGYFLGLVAWFAAHLEPSAESLAHLLGASTIGSAAGWVSHYVPARIVKPS